MEKLLGSEPWTVSDIAAASRDEFKITLSSDPVWQEKLERSVDFLEQEWAADRPVYGVTTGYGDSARIVIPRELVEALPTQLMRFHGCGLGNILSESQARAVIAVRLVSLSQGYSGVRLLLLQRLADLFNAGIVPCIPEEGSVGASGDLTPLSYIAALLCGERDVFFRGERLPAGKVFADLNIEPLQLRPKEALALMNGTSVMTALAAMALDRASYLSRLVSRTTAMLIEALGANRTHFDPRLFALKPHPGQQQVAGRIKGDLMESSRFSAGAIQDVYSLRCAPHIIGVLEDALPWMKRSLEIEINSVNDNPVIIGEEGVVLHGGHFYGGHVAFVADSLKNTIANIADLLDRQLGVLVDSRVNNGLPRGLSSAPEELACINHGFKAVQIGTSAWAAEALKLTMPASVFSRSTECHNQDKVSMGTISARDCLRVLMLCEQCVAANLLATTQAIGIRASRGELHLSELQPGVRRTVEQVSDVFPPLENDRPLEGELRQMMTLVQEQAFELYSE